MSKVRKEILSQEEQDVFLIRKTKVNYVNASEPILEAIVNRVIFFRYECEASVLRIYVKGTSIKDKEHLFKELTQVNLTSGAALHDFAKDWYQEHLEELRLFVKGE